MFKNSCYFYLFFFQLCFCVDFFFVLTSIDYSCSAQVLLPSSFVPSSFVRSSCHFSPLWRHERWGPLGRCCPESAAPQLLWRHSYVRSHSHIGSVLFSTKWPKRGLVYSHFYFYIIDFLHKFLNNRCKKFLTFSKL